MDVRHAGALIAARYATGGAVTPISTSPQPAVSAKGAGFRVKHEMLDDFLPARTRRSVGLNALCVSPTDNSSLDAISCYNSFLNVIAFPASKLQDCSRVAARWSFQYNGVRNEPAANREQPRRGQASNQRRAQQVEHGKRKQAEAQTTAPNTNLKRPMRLTTGQRG